MILVYGSCSHYWRGRIGSDLWRRFRRARVPHSDLRERNRVATGLWPVQDRAQRGGYNFKGSYAITVPLMDTTIYLDYLANRFVSAGGSISAKVRFEKLEEIDPKFDLVINCAGIGARELVHDADLEPHRGQVAII